jgi:hypothetical protein
MMPPPPNTTAWRRTSQAFSNQRTTRSLLADVESTSARAGPSLTKRVHAHQAPQKVATSRAAKYRSRLGPLPEQPAPRGRRSKLSTDGNVTMAVTANEVRTRGFRRDRGVENRSLNVSVETIAEPIPRLMRIVRTRFVVVCRYWANGSGARSRFAPTGRSIAAMSLG